MSSETWTLTRPMNCGDYAYIMQAVSPTGKWEDAKIEIWWRMRNAGGHGNYYRHFLTQLPVAESFSETARFAESLLDYYVKVIQ